MKSQNVDNNRLNRLKLALADYDFEIKYVKGKENVIPDYWSRHPCETDANIYIQGNEVKIFHLHYI